MKATGIVRRIDDLGRVVIPKEIRRTMRIREGDPPQIHTNAKKKETTRFSVWSLFVCKRLPIVPGRFQPSIVGTSELNCRVRDGNGCTLTVIDTYYSGSGPEN